MTLSSVRKGRGNRLLQLLSRSDAALLKPYLRPIELAFRQRLEAANRAIPAVYFLESGLASVVSVSRTGRPRAEVGIIGREGMTGRACVLGLACTLQDTFVQVPGRALSIAVPDLRRAMVASRSLTAHLLRYVYCFSVQAECAALANAEGTLEERLARRLLMAHDRIEGNNLTLTHELLSLMLCTRRAGVTQALHRLEGRGLIAIQRKMISIVDRAGLEAASAGLYGIPEGEYESVFGS